MEFVIAILVLGLAAGFSGKKEKPKDIKRVKTCHVKTYKKDCKWKRIR